MFFRVVHKEKVAKQPARYILPRFTPNVLWILRDLEFSADLCDFPSLFLQTLDFAVRFPLTSFFPVVPPRVQDDPFVLLGERKSVHAYLPKPVHSYLPMIVHSYLPFTMLQIGFLLLQMLKKPVSG